MKTILATTAAIFTIAAPAWAATVAELDTNTDGLVSFEEVQAVYPDTTAEAFAALDVDGDGSLNEEELSAAQE